MYQHVKDTAYTTSMSHHMHQPNYITDRPMLEKMNMHMMDDLKKYSESMYRLGALAPVKRDDGKIH